MTYYYKTGVIVPFMQKFYKQLIVVVAGLFIASMATMSLGVNAASTTEVVTGNTVDTMLGENGSEGWWFNRDTNTDTPYNFVNGNAKIGSGSLFVPPVGATAADKFVGEYFVFDRMSEVESFSFDFKTNSVANETKEEQFYLNVYANFEVSGPTKFYDCRYNIVATTGSSTMYNTVSFDVDTAVVGPSSVTTRGGAQASPLPCPATPADMGDSAYVRAFAINLGDSTVSDTGVGGYFDRAVYQTTTDTTTFDFERLQNTGVISSPVAGSIVSGTVDLLASYNDNDPDVDGVQWAVRSGTCAAGTGTVLGNVDGNSDVAVWDGAEFSYTLDTTELADGSYCFVFNPSDDAGENNVRVTSQFTVDNPVVLGSKEECKKGGWATSEVPVFKNQGQCVSHFASGGTSTSARTKNQ